MKNEALLHSQFTFSERSAVTPRIIKEEQYTNRYSASKNNQISARSKDSYVYSEAREQDLNDKMIS